MTLGQAARPASDQTPGSADRAVGPLLWVCALLAATSATVGLLWHGEGARGSAVSAHGERIELYGVGLYRNDTVFIAAGNRGSDLVILTLVVPLLCALAVMWGHRGPRVTASTAALAGVIAYVAGVRALESAYNELFLAYVALLAAAVGVLVLAFRELPRLFAGVPAQTLPRRGPAMLLFVAGALTVVVWTAPVVASLLAAGPLQPPGGRTVSATEVIDLAIVVPAAFAAGALILRRRPHGYAMAVPVLALLVALLVLIGAQTVFQIRAGVEFTPPEIAGPIGGFLVLASLGAVVLWRLIRSLPGPSGEHDIPRTRSGDPMAEHGR